MCVLVIKKDEHGCPAHAKSRIIVLGNHETTYWSKGDVYVPVATQEVVRLLISLAVGHSCTAKKGD